MKNDDEKLNKEIEKLYKKLENGSTEQDELMYIWLSELKDKRKNENTVMSISKLLINTDNLILNIENDSDIIGKEDIEIEDIKYSDYAESKVEEIYFDIELIKSCELNLDITPVLVIKDKYQDRRK